MYVSICMRVSADLYTIRRVLSVFRLARRPKGKSHRIGKATKDAENPKKQERGGQSATVQSEKKWSRSMNGSPAWPTSRRRTAA